ncbi:transcriptional regulator, AraC family with amidase-like domain [Rhizobium sp. RU20A]|uniref:GlxA family transcriptional regulator n=1 Tax=Rhizobium sp. RU20A TaxID=1907412 RepID=UPI000955406D|nr:GlxA family transcriptional regulator [Rhizobium sp. RU20A]SIQ62440.1 transcriptional regulator, AraC family with amidase-like domain [Rhizobium sp. RU20A]
MAGAQGGVARRPAGGRARADGAAPDRKLKVGFVLARLFTLSAFSLFIDTLRLASDELDRSGRVKADWELLGSTRHLIRSSCGVSVAPTADLTRPERFDMIVVVGGRLESEELCDEETLRFLHQAAERRIPLIGLCTGTFILAEAGLLTRHQTCVSWLHYASFRERFPDLKARPDRLFNFDGSRGSCAGGMSSADLAAHIIRTFIGRDAEQNALEVLQIGRARAPNDTQTRAPLQSLEGMATTERRVNATLITMEQHLAEPKSIQALAGMVGLSRRQLERLFLTTLGMAPAHAYNLVRLQRARELLASTDRPIIAIAIDVGFNNASHFSRAFRRTYGVSPTQVRSGFARLPEEGELEGPKDGEAEAGSSAAESLPA